jgi:hypothetical protein
MGFTLYLRSRMVIGAAASCVFAAVSPYAMADGPPVVLDTQTGIHDGQSGIVLQNAPLSRAPMVPAQQLPTPTELNATSGDQPLVVAPYIALPGANGAAPASRYGNRMPPASRQ